VTGPSTNLVTKAPTLRRMTTRTCAQRAAHPRVLALAKLYAFRVPGISACGETIPRSTRIIPSPAPWLRALARSSPIGIHTRPSHNVRSTRSSEAILRILGSFFESRVGAARGTGTPLLRSPRYGRRMPRFPPMGLHSSSMQS